MVLLFMGAHAFTSRCKRMPSWGGQEAALPPLPTALDVHFVTLSGSFGEIMQRVTLFLDYYREAVSPAPVERCLAGMARSYNSAVHGGSL